MDNLETMAALHIYIFIQFIKTFFFKYKQKLIKALSDPELPTSKSIIAPIKYAGYILLYYVYECDLSQIVSRYTELEYSRPISGILVDLERQQLSPPPK